MYEKVRIRPGAKLKPFADLKPSPKLDFRTVPDGSKDPHEHNFPVQTTPRRPISLDSRIDEVVCKAREGEADSIRHIEQIAQNCLSTLGELIDRGYQLAADCLHSALEESVRSFVDQCKRKPHLFQKKAKVRSYWPALIARNTRTPT